jgi:hypothetical protein
MEERQEGGAQRAPQSRIQSECALTYKNAVFWKNLTDALPIDANHVGTASDTSDALGDGRDRARFCRTTATCIWGVSDPLPAEARGRDWGVAEGVAPQMTPSPLLTAAPTATRAAKSAARLTVVKLLIAKNIAHVTRRCTHVPVAAR